MAAAATPIKTPIDSILKSNEAITYELRYPADDIKDAEDDHKTSEFDLLLGLAAPGGTRRRVARRAPLKERLMAAVAVARARRWRGRRFFDAQLPSEEAVAVLRHAGRHEHCLATVGRQIDAHLVGDAPVLAPPVHLMQRLDDAQIAAHNDDAHNDALN